MALKRARIEIYRTADGFRWRRKARNGRITHASEESKENLSRLHTQLRKMFPGEEIIPPGRTTSARARVRDPRGFAR